MGGPREFLLAISLTLLGRVWDGFVPTVKLPSGQYCASCRRNWLFRGLNASLENEYGTSLAPGMVPRTEMSLYFA